jgi:hypothetical protein
MSTGQVHTTGFAPELLYPGLAALWGQNYKQHPKKCERFFLQKDSNQRFEKEQEMSGFTTAGVKDEGDAVPFGRLTQGFQEEYVHITYGLGAIVTREMMEDDQYGFINQIPRLLTEAMVRTEETVSTAVLNNAFDASFAGADGSALCASDHSFSGSGGGTWSNIPTVAVDLTQTSLESAYIDVLNLRDANNQRLSYTPQQLIVSRGDFFNAQKILKTEYKTGSADNDVNILSEVGLELIWTNYLTDTDAWFLRNKIPNGLTHYTRRAADIERDNDRVGTQNLAIVTTKRFSVGFTDARDIWGSQGA